VPPSGLWFNDIHVLRYKRQRAALDTQLTLMIMSGVEDGKTLALDGELGDGTFHNGDWTLTIGRQDNRDVRLQKDTFISRDHALLVLSGGVWHLDDCGSKNGTFVEIDGEPVRVETIVSLEPGQLFRIGRTWLRIQGEADQVDQYLADSVPPDDSMGG
jgi:pSer/pThr/pTyr-binding forkhead associated (FHA) protein